MLLGGLPTDVWEARTNGAQGTNAPHGWGGKQPRGGAWVMAADGAGRARPKEGWGVVGHPRPQGGVARPRREG